MVEYDGSKCTPHGQTRCAICQAMAAKGKRPSSLEMPPPSIAGGPPPDIEGLGNVRDVRTGQVLRLADTYYWAGKNFAVIVAELEYWKPTWEEELDAR